MTTRPVATYRLQLHSGFNLADARRIIDYLDELGITTVYASPLLAAEPGSTHGYDLVDPGRLNPELGTEVEFDEFCSELRSRDLGLLVDFVPNHMGIGSEANRFWNDVLEHGPSSRFASFFDIDWNPPKASLRNRVLLPILGDQYGEVLERGELKLVYHDGGFVVRLGERGLPVEPTTVIPILEDLRHQSGLPPEDTDRQQLDAVILALKELPAPTDIANDSKSRRARETPVLKHKLHDVLSRNTSIRAALEQTLLAINGNPAAPSSFDRLDALLREQNYRLCSWQVATEEINYRRFFDVNALAAVRMERAEVFELMHGVVFRWIREGRVCGLRLDHTDGLLDPGAYFEALQVSAVDLLPEDRIRDDPKNPLYLVAEKILEPGEELPPAWRIHGTTGYDFLRVCNELWVDPASKTRLSRVWERFSENKRSFEEQAYESKRLIMETSLASEVNVLARRLSRIAEQNRRSRDFTLMSLTTAIVETIAAFKVYRTYLQPSGESEVSDATYVNRAVNYARKKNPSLSPTIFHFLRDVLLMNRVYATDSKEQLEFALRFQQLTGPIMAKGVEDTAFYRHRRLVSLNEVGSDPSHFGTRLEQFHAHNRRCLERWPFSMTTLSTHDTKRGEDFRARISVLSEMPDDWRRTVSRLSGLARKHTRRYEDERLPIASDEYLFYQTLVGALPFEWQPHDSVFVDRMCAYMSKALKEAKERTSWINPDPDYDEATKVFVRGTMNDTAFIEEVKAFVDRIATYGVSNSLAQTLLRICSPGVPDTYQGCELWSFSLVDPDNRRPVDYDVRRHVLRNLKARSHEPLTLAKQLLAEYQNGTVKMYVLHSALQARRKCPELFCKGSYQPLSISVSGTAAKATIPYPHVIAFARAWEDQSMVCCVPRWVYRLTRGATPWALGTTWGELSISGLEPGRQYTNILTDERLSAEDGTIRLAGVLRNFPVALLWAER